VHRQADGPAAARRLNRNRRSCRRLILIGLILPAAIATGQSVDPERLVRINEGISAFDRGEYDRSAALFSALVDELPTDIASQYYLALTRMQLAIRAVDGEQRTRLFAQAGDGLSRALAARPAMVDAYLDLGIARLGDRGRESAAVDALERYVASPDGESDAYGHFFLAVAQYRLGRYPEALAALATAELLDDLLAPFTRFYKGLVLSRTGKSDEATDVFAEVAELAPGTALAQRAETLTREVGAPAGGAVGGSIRIGSAYDSNVVLLGGNTTLPNDLSSRDDFRFGIETDVYASYAVPPEELSIGESLNLGLGGFTYNSWHTAVEEFDVQTYGGHVFIDYEPRADLFVGIQYDYDYNLVGNDAFLSRNRVTPLVKIIEWRDDDDEAEPRTWSTVYYAYEDRDYFEPLFDPRLDRDGSYHTYGLTQEFNALRPWPDDDRWLVARIGGRFQRASTHGDDFDVNATTLTAGLRVPLPWTLTFDFAGEWSWEDYSQPNTIDFERREREDFVQRYLFGLTKHVNENLEIRAEVNLIFDDSNVLDRFNQTPYSHDRSIWTISVVYRF